jgi:hypothetical protein
MGSEGQAAALENDCRSAAAARSASERGPKTKTSQSTRNLAAVGCNGLFGPVLLLLSPVSHQLGEALLGSKLGGPNPILPPAFLERVAVHLHDGESRAPHV